MLFDSFICIQYSSIEIIASIFRLDCTTESGLWSWIGCRETEKSSKSIKEALRLYYLNFRWAVVKRISYVLYGMVFFYLASKLVSLLVIYENENVLVYHKYYDCVFLSSFCISLKQSKRL